MSDVKPVDEKDESKTDESKETTTSEKSDSTTLEKLVNHLGYLGRKPDFSKEDIDDIKAKLEALIVANAGDEKLLDTLKSVSETKPVDESKYVSREEYEARLLELAREKAKTRYELSDEDMEFVKGDTEEQILANAEKLKVRLGAVKVEVPSYKPKSNVQDEAEKAFKDFYNR